MYLRLCLVEMAKLRRTKLPYLLLIIPLIGAFLGILNFSVNIDVFMKDSIDGFWIKAWSQVVLCHASLIFPVFTGVLTVLMCRGEHSGGGWKQLLALPVTRTSVYLSKLSVVSILIGLTQTALLLFFVFMGFLWGFTGSVPWGLLIKMVFMGGIAALPLAAIQMIFSVRYPSFAAPLAINIVLTLPTVFVVNTSLGRFYPWAIPAFAMSSDNYVSNQSQGVFFIQMMFLLVIAVGLGLLLFTKRNAP